MVVGFVGSRLLNGTFVWPEPAAWLVLLAAPARIMARTAAYIGREVTWDEMLKSTEVWDPKIDLNKLRQSLLTTREKPRGYLTRLILRKKHRDFL